MAAAAILIPPFLFSLQGCDSEPTASPDPCPTSGTWSLSGGAGTTLDPRCAWSGVITLSHTESTEEERDFLDDAGGRHRVLGQSRADREIEIQLTAERANGTVDGTWTGMWDVTTVHACDDGRPGNTTHKMDSEYEIQFSGSGRVEVTLTLKPDGAYRLDFTGPKEKQEKTGTTAIHYSDTCSDPPFSLDHEESGTDQDEFDPFPFSVQGRITPGADRISGAAETPLPIITPLVGPGMTGSVATVYTATWKLERKG
jgi:hypothetical protein